MADFKDLFSGYAQDYARYRPTYPHALFEYLSTIIPERQWAWDCGTGNGQAALELAHYFQKVTATDPSSKQLKEAPAHPRIEYRVAMAENSGLPARSIDLITVAQAFHWFHQPDFFSEVARVAKPDAVLAIWSYAVLQTTPELQKVIKKLYIDILGTYWEPERQLVDEGNRNEKIPFKEFSPPQFQIKAEWNLEHLVGYLSTWSALQTYIKKNKVNPLQEVLPEIKSAWGDVQMRTILWPVDLRIFKI
jgi:SAM-dependent methyltransferase